MWSLIRRLVLVGSTGVVLSLALVGTSSAAPLFDEVCNGSAANSTVCQDQKKAQTDSNNSFFGKNGVLVKAANLLALVTGVAAVIMVIIGGIKYVLASGDPSNVTSAKNTIIFAIVGLLVVVVARSIIVFVINRLG